MSVEPTPQEKHLRDVLNAAKVRLQNIHRSAQAGGASMSEVLREVGRVADMIAGRLGATAKEERGGQGE